MTNEKLSIQLSVDEVQALLELAENQLFRIRFIDPKIPGHQASPEKLQVQKAAVQVLQEAFKKAKGFAPTEQGHLKDNQVTLKRSAG